MDLDEYILEKWCDLKQEAGFSISLLRAEQNSLLEGKERNCGETDNNIFETFTKPYENSVIIYGLVSYRNKYGLGNSNNNNRMGKMEKELSEIIEKFRIGMKSWMFQGNR